MANLFEELKRRKVFNTAAMYVVGAWLLIQIADVILPTFNAPLWVNQAIILSLLAGFPVAMSLAWFFKISADGSPESEEDLRSRSENLAVRYLAAATVLVVASIGLLVFQIVSQQSDQHVGSDNGLNSIAVLPFDDFSAESDQQWFADGLSEEILNSLVRMGEFEVASRTSSFGFRDSDLEVTQIADELGVGYILEGSVRRAPQQLRITVQLVRASDGFHVWSDNYDRSPEDAIAIQEEVAISIAEAMGTALDADALESMAASGTDSIPAYLAYLRGQAAGEFCERVAGCYENFEQAALLDPEFAEAHFELARFWYMHLDPVIASLENELEWAMILERFHTRINLAIQHAEDPLNLIKYRAYRERVNINLVTHRDLLKQYIAQRPYDSIARTQYVIAEITLSNFDDAIAELDKWVEFIGEDLDELGWPILLYSYAHAHDKSNALVDQTLVGPVMLDSAQFVYYQLHRSYIFAGKSEEAANALRLFQQSPSTDPVFAQLGILMAVRQACMEGRRDDALPMVEALISQIPLTESGVPNMNILVPYWDVLLAAGLINRLEEMLQNFNNPEEAFVLSTFLRFPYFDPQPYDALMAILEAQGIDRPAANPPVFACEP